MNQLGTSYSLSSYGDMIRDRGRMEPYVAALKKAIQPGCTVLDIGAGTGVFSLLACQMGAAKVIAVEANPAIRIVREIAAANGYADKITCFEGFSTDLALDQLADVIVSDLRGALPLFHMHLPSIMDARDRLLAPGGIMIPQRDFLWAAPLDSPGAYQRLEHPWLTNEYNLDLSAAYRLEVNRWGRHPIAPKELLAPAQQWLELDYRTLTSCNGSGDLSWESTQAGHLHGLGVWFSTELIDGVGYSNAPDQPQLIYGQTFFPISTPVQIDPGDRIEATISAHWVDQEYIWRWQGRVLTPAGAIKVTFDQSTFNASLLSTKEIKYKRGDFVPQITIEVEIEQLILSHVDGQTPMSDLVTLLCQAYPQRFDKRQRALSRIAETFKRMNA